MRRGYRLHENTANCRRCGRPYCASDGLTCSLDKTKQKYERICPQCITPQEKRDILRTQAATIHGKRIIL